MGIVLTVTGRVVAHCFKPKKEGEAFLPPPPPPPKPPAAKFAS